MGTKTTQRWCPTERRPVLAQYRTPNHILHLLLALVTGGLWLIVWAAVGIGADRRYRCPSCGSATQAMRMRLNAPRFERPKGKRGGWVLAAQAMVAVGIVVVLAVRIFS